MKQEKEKTMLSLSEIPTQTPAMIVRVDTPPELRQRLHELGFTPNTIVQLLLSNPHRIICELHSTRIGMQKDIADSIMVTPLSSTEML